MVADARLNTKLVNQSAFNTMAKRGAVNGVSVAASNEDWVEFMNVGLILKLWSCADISARITFVVSAAAGCNNGYDCTLKAVKMEENRPAYKVD